MSQSSPFFVRESEAFVGRKERKTCTRKNGGVLGEESRGGQLQLPSIALDHPTQRSNGAACALTFKQHG